MPCELGVDVTFLPWGVTAEEIDAPVVFAGYGQVNAAEKIDDFEGIDVKGRFVLTFAGQRPGKDGDKTAGEPRPARRGRRGCSTASTWPGTEKALERGALGNDRDLSPDCRVTTVGANAAQPMALFGFGQPSMTLGHAPNSSQPFRSPTRSAT